MDNLSNFSGQSVQYLVDNLSNT